MRVMITGATTPIGRALIQELLDHGAERILAVGGEPGRRDAQGNPRLRYERVDLRRERSLRRLLFGAAQQEGIDTIIDMARHRSASAQGADAHRLNVGATRLMLRLSEELPAMRRYVFRSFGEIYAVGHGLPAVLDEEQPLRIGGGVPQWVLDRVEADLAACARMGMSRISIAVLRASECLAPGTGSQLYDYLQSRACFRPLGFDPIINVISEADLGRALRLAAQSDAEGVFNIPGKDTLPLSKLIERYDCREIPMPGPVLRPLYALRRSLLGRDFDYGINVQRWHFGGVLDGRRAAERLGYRPERPVRFPLRLHAVGGR